MNMSDNSNRVLIPVETRSRELSAKLFLSTVLAGRGYAVYLGNKIQHTALDKINPDVYFELSGKNHAARLRRLNEHGIRTLVLETEGSAFSGVEEFSKLMDVETLKHTDCYCAWGTTAKETVESVAPDTRVEVTGNPRFDLLQKPYREFYANDAEQIRDEYGEFILFNTNYSMSNGDKPAKTVYSNCDDDSERDYLARYHKKEVKIFGEFVRLIAEAAEQFPNKNIIVRPHPGENPDFYQSCLYAYDNVHIERRLEVRPWIMAAETVVHNSCTTGITSALLDTPVIAYLPDGLEVSSPPNEISNQCETVSEVCEALENYVSDKNPYRPDSEKKRVIKQYIDNVDYLSVERIADVIDSVAPEERTTPLTPDSRLQLRRLFVRAVGAERFEELWVKKIRGETRHKFPYTATAEVTAIVNQFVDDNKPPHLRIERLPYIVNGFRLWCDR